ncbi:MAG: phosphotransferase, partial [Clostridia bacterium]|nr:phosphotransferase [Clostridia bacterium]
MIHFNEIAARYGIGMLLSTPTPVLGGLLHTTYRLDAAEGSFAVKILNPAVMKRPEALGNMIRSEQIAAAFRGSLPAVSALEVDGSPVQKIGGEAVMLYPWISGRPVFPPKLSARHAAAVGDLLARMHGAGETLFGTIDEKPEKEAPLDWESLAEEAGSLSPDAPWLPALKAALPDLISRDADAREAASVLEKTALSHRDLDPKNVLWEGANPHVIDWESAGPVHP